MAYGNTLYMEKHLDYVILTTFYCLNRPLLVPEMISEKIRFCEIKRSQKIFFVGSCDFRDHVSLSCPTGGNFTSFV